MLYAELKAAEMGTFGKIRTSLLKIVPFSYKKWILSVKETTSGGRCGFSSQPFRALRQPVRVTACRRAFFCLLMENDTANQNVKVRKSI